MTNIVLSAFTNIVVFTNVVVSIAIVTVEIDEQLDPSGQVKHLNTLVLKQASAAVTNQGEVFNLMCSHPVSTNWSRWEWCQTALEPNRDPLNDKSIPSRIKPHKEVPP